MRFSKLSDDEIKIILEYLFFRQQLKLFWKRGNFKDKTLWQMGFLKQEPTPCLKAESWEW
jgi:hypothetical protein